MRRWGGKEEQQNEMKRIGSTGECGDGDRRCDNIVRGGGSDK
jgi:hypothetical protein